ncbi:polysaccharide deacetylase family protein [Methylocystis heyeri]|uniref:Chitooligosaccharide deacetylase n=1 Tax=Methylocystis heyeri TaxID=391905 RepID=A0A6B8KEF1_9HYPH|nr:polysaccharide deacetylase family protein [Methylocystis heyeri]QGM44813.1 polysaccharide deacetylase family protein [Methylocystis heyeri]
MTNWREIAIEAGMGFFRASGAHRLAEAYTRGRGAILMLHSVRNPAHRDFAPNQTLEISPDFLEALLDHLHNRGVRIVSLDDALAELRRGESDAPPFVALTFDDGYRDLVENALPVMERRGAPFTAYIASGFADGSARLWWVEMEEAFRRLDRIDIVAGGRRLDMRCETAAEKSEAFSELYWLLRAGGEEELLRVSLALCAEARIDPLRLTANLCLDWKALEPLARHELATIGAHSVTHARLAKLDAGAAIREMSESRAAIVRELGVDARHFCYPVGDATSAGRREFTLARELGFASGVTTRPGMLFSEHAEHLHALPRLSVNGRHQSLEEFDILLSGAPFALMNRGRKVVAA